LYLVKTIKAFTLIELLVVIAIIAILAAILFPVFALAKRAAKSSVSLSNQKQMGMASMMYVNDNDDILPETGLDGPCSSPNLNVLGYVDVPQSYNLFSGVFAWPMAIKPYMKNLDIFRCPIDPDYAGWNKSSSACFETQLVLSGVPGAYVGMRSRPNLMKETFKLSYASNFMLSLTYNGGAGPRTARSQLKMPSMSAINYVANTFYLTDLGSNDVLNTAYNGWYIIPGYRIDTVDTRWRRGGRHGAGGRNWTFTDGHAKYFKDPEYSSGPLALRTGVIEEIIQEYERKGVYTYITKEPRL
jgi:prepilin-type N-terminal cleavage/methylation domain-containing protein/prepilin-type processing-associated H-X9-DG protein